MSNELMQITVKEETEIVQGTDGKFKRVVKYQPFASVKAETKEQKIKVMNLLNSSDGDEDAAKPFKNAIGTELAIADVIFNPYDSVDEETGELTDGVVVYIADHDYNWYVTSSKTVYFHLKRLMQVFGEPHWEPDMAPVVKIITKKGQKHDVVDIKVIG